MRATDTVILQDVSYSILDANNERKLLNHLSISFNTGMISSISGPSGSGKTTLLYAISGLLSNVSGKIIVDNTDINALPPSERDLFRLKNIGLVFQNLNLFPFMNVKDNILTPLYLRKIKITREIEERMFLFFDIMNLGLIQDKPIYSLSGGEQQRVAIIRSLIGDPKVVLCDEPTASLDRANAQLFMSALLSIKKETNASIIITTHDPFVHDCSELRFDLIDGNLRCSSN